MNAIVRRRRRAAVALTLFVLALGIVLAITLGSSILPIYMTSLPLALFLLWSGVDELRADEQRLGPSTT